MCLVGFKMVGRVWLTTSRVVALPQHEQMKTLRVLTALLKEDCRITCRLPAERRNIPKSIVVTSLVEDLDKRKLDIAVGLFRMRLQVNNENNTSTHVKTC